MKIEITINGNIGKEEVVELYKVNEWSSAEKPDTLIAALRNSDTLVTARIEGKLIGLANAISDGHLVVYYPHMLVHPKYQGQGVGHKIMQAMLSRYKDFHQQMLTADGKAIEFYEKMGFERAGKTEPMWIYGGNDH